jgi:hypothetical protein
MATKKWVPIVVGIVIFVILVGAGLMGGLVFFVTRHAKVQAVTTEEGQAEFDRLVARVAGQKPFIELPAPDSDGLPIVHRELETHDTGSISTVHIRVWSPAKKTMARIDLPFWLMRLGGDKPFTVNAGPLNDVTLHVTPEEIDRRGPGLIVLWTTSRDARLLVWTE